MSKFQSIRCKILDEDNFYDFLKESSKEDIIALYQELDVYLDAQHLLAPVMEELFEDMKIIITSVIGARYISELIKEVEDLDPND